jgi:glucan phosphoethanolaminetransferase (alkaline phosphatase superfamily)
MALKLFRSTGHSTLLLPGETRLLPHPQWMVLAVSAWLGIACNVGLWRLITRGADEALQALTAVAVLAGGSGLALSLFCWRRTMRPIATLLLFGGALLACSLWIQQLPIEALWMQRPATLLPAWTSFMRGSVVWLMLLLAVAPIAWVWHGAWRRLPGPSQLRANALSATGFALLLGAGLLLAQRVS